MCPGDAVRSTFHDDQPASVDKLGCAPSRSGEGKNPVGIAMNDQRRHVDAFEVLPEVGQPCRDAIQSTLGRGACCYGPTILNNLVTDQFAPQDVNVVEIGEKLAKESRTVSSYSFRDAVEDAAVHAFRVVGRFQQEWRN